MVIILTGIESELINSEDKIKAYNSRFLKNNNILIL